MKWWNKILLFLTIAVALMLAGSYLALYVDPQKFWLPAFLGLGYIPILIAYVLFSVYWFFVKRKIFYGLLIFFLIGYRTHLNYFSFGALQPVKAEENVPTYKILQYNTKEFDAYNPKGKYLERDQIVANIASEKPDIACLEEFNTYQNGSTEKSNIDMVMQATGLPYYYYFKAYENSKATRSFGIIIFSRFPILDTGRLDYISMSRINSTIFADLKIGVDTVRLFCCHLQSTQLSHNDFEFIEPTSEQSPTNFDADRVTNKLKISYALHAEEADTVAAAIKRSPHPVIVCGDFNDVPVSYTYHQISDNLQDAFLKRGFGIGASYNPFPLIRIDYQLFDENKFRVLSYKKIRDKSSDHYPCVTTFQVNDK